MHDRILNGEFERKQGVPVRVRPRAPWLYSYGFESYVRIVSPTVSAKRLFRPRIHQGLDVRGVACSRCRQL